MKREDQIAIRKIIWGFLVGGVLILMLILVASLIKFELFPDDSKIIGDFKDRTGKIYTLKNYPGNAVTSNSLQIFIGEAIPSNSIKVLITGENYKQITYSEVINDSTVFIGLMSEKSKKTDTIFFIKGKT